MESAQTPVTLIPVYIIRTTVVKVEEVFEVISGSKRGDETILLKESRGWFVTFAGSREALHFGTEKPSFAVGDHAEIRIRHVPAP